MLVLGSSKSNKGGLPKIAIAIESLFWYPSDKVFNY